MFFVASKILAWFIHPLSIVLLLLIVGLRAALLKKKATSYGLFVLAALALYGFSIEAVPDLLVRPLEGKHFSVDPTELKADAIVVLAGNPKRVLKGVRLFKRGAAPIMIMVGGSGDLFDPGRKDAVRMKELAVQLGVPAEKILIEAQSRNTREGTLYVKGILDQLKAKRVILVTSAFHMPRSYALFKKAGINAVPVKSDFYSTGDGYGPSSFVPAAGNFVRSRSAIKEYAAILVYRLLGWI